MVKNPENNQCVENVSAQRVFSRAYYPEMGLRFWLQGPRFFEFHIRYWITPKQSEVGSQLMVGFSFGWR